MKEHQAVVSYLRVSTKRQSAEGLGIAAQRHAVESYLRSTSAKLLQEYVEVESGRVKERQQLQAAIAQCRKQRATLVIARLDRLARNAAFLLGLRDSGVEFTCCDMPQADSFTVGILALVAEKEAQMISERTRAALQAAKRRGRVLGNPKLKQVQPKAVAANQRRAARFAEKLGPVLEEIKHAGVTTLKGIAQCLNARGFLTPLGRPFTRQAVARIQLRLS